MGRVRAIAVTSPHSSPTNNDARQVQSTTICDPRSGRSLRVRLPPTDIEACIRFSYWRCIVSIIGFALVLTDIPRTGLALVIDKYPQVAPNAFSNYGPYAYPTIHINRSSESSNATYRGLKKGKPVTSTTVWAYKFDTVSIAQRAMAQHLNVATYPDCILYRSVCPSSTLSLQTTFAMIDGWVSAMQTKHFGVGGSDSGLPVVYMTKNNWIDRLHHILVKPLYRRQDKRIHTVHFYSTPTNSTQPLSVCTHPNSTFFPALYRQQHRRALRPLICDLLVKARFKHPFPPPPPAAPPPLVSPSRHIEVRFDELRRQYPDLVLDTTILTTRFLLSSEAFYSKLPLVFFMTDNAEVTTWIRGRKCTESVCTTVFVDDYRYEATVLTTSTNDWCFITSVLRGFAQGYIWIRFLLLCWSCYAARCGEPKFVDRPWFVRVFPALKTLSRIPSHVVVYGSWLPVLSYTVAHTIDSGVTHMLSNSVWASIDGLFQFHLMGYIVSASIQMRNIWMIAFVWKAIAWATSIVNGKRRDEPWRPFHGFVAVRGIFMSFISWLTIFVFLRALRFRDTDVISVTEFPRHVPFNGLRFTPSYTNIADFGYRLDIKTALVAITLVVFGSVVFQTIIQSLTGQRTRFLFCRTNYIPHSADSVWPRHMLDMHWSDRLVRSTSIPRETGSLTLRQAWRKSSRLLSQTLRPKPSTSLHADCPVCRFTPSVLHWRGVQGCVDHDRIFNAIQRHKSVASMLKLINLTMMSDPIIFTRLRVQGTPLLLIASKSSDEEQSSRIDPAVEFSALTTLVTRNHDQGIRTHPEHTSIVDSRLISWNVVVQCG